MNIVIDEHGVRSTTAKVTNIAEMQVANEIGAVIALPLGMLNSAVIEHFDRPEPTPAREPVIFVPRSYDQELGGYGDFTPVPLGIAEEPRGLEVEPAEWFIQAVRKAQPDHFAWRNAEGDNDIDTAIFIFENSYRVTRESEKILDSCHGWIDDEIRGTSLVIDLYEASESVLGAIQDFVYSAGLRFFISGRSFHYPSRTFRVTIFKEQNGGKQISISSSN